MSAQPVINMPHALDLEKGESHAQVGHHHRGKLKQGEATSELRYEHRIFGFKLDDFAPWAKYLSLASMVFLLSLSAAYCAELVFIKAGEYDISTSTASSPHASPVPRRL